MPRKRVRRGGGRKRKRKGFHGIPTAEIQRLFTDSLKSADKELQAIETIQRELSAISLGQARPSKKRLKELDAVGRTVLKALKERHALVLALIRRKKRDTKRFPDSEVLSAELHFLYDVEDQLIGLTCDLEAAINQLRSFARRTKR